MHHLVLGHTVHESADFADGQVRQPNVVILGQCYLVNGEQGQPFQSRPWLCTRATFCGLPSQACYPLPFLLPLL